MKESVVIVGAGALGARHLESLARLDRRLSVDVVDPMDAARTRALSVLEQAGGLQGGTVRGHADLGSLDGVPDIAIVATNSRERPGVISELLDRGVRRFVLEKVLFTRLADYDAIDRRIAETGAFAWVNCARRAYPRAGELTEFVNGRPFDYTVEGTGWGLGSNLVHHLDEAAMLSDSTDFDLSVDDLLPGSAPAKRSGYIELLGRISGKSKAGRFVALCKAGSPADRVVTIDLGRERVVIAQAGKTITFSDSRGSRTEPFPMPLQSEMTANHVSAILDGNAPALPDYATASKLHRVMLSAFLAHLRKSDASIDECPVT